MFEELLKTSKSALKGVDTYLSFAENRLGRAAVTRLHSSRQAAIAGSITLVHGVTGVGKTHILTALGMAACDTAKSEIVKLPSKISRV